MKQVRWAMVGSGLMAELIIHDFALARNTSLVAMVTRNPAATSAKLAEWGVEAQTIESLEVAAASPDIDLIYIATPHSEHYWMAKLALDAGKHVLIEKAFAMNQAQAIELRDLAAARGLFLMEAMWSKFNPLLNRLKQIIGAGAIGQLKLVEANFGFKVPFDPAHRLFDPGLGGGTILDQGVYAATVASWFAGAPLQHILAQGECFGNGTDAMVVSQMRFQNGVLAHTATALNTPFGTGARLVGSDGIIEVSGVFWAPERAFITAPADSPDTATEEVFEAMDGAGYSHMIRKVSQAIIDGQTGTTEHPLSHTIEVAGILDEMRRQIVA